MSERVIESVRTSTKEIENENRKRKGRFPSDAIVLSHITGSLP